ncbi:MAG: methyltransferase domain-containing protein [Ginsengibacter sp.]|jgi:2-polyprenyl-3-methyl-5-hydroxy-6-metoxy-1,4-benzoquinol methylase
MEDSKNSPLKLEESVCCICDTNHARKIGSGMDYEYHSSSQTFSALQCENCGLVYLNPRPAMTEFERIYPSDYHAFNFSEKDFGLVFKIRAWLESRRALSWCKNIPDNAHILDVGCGDGFHLKLLKEYGKKEWQLEGVDFDERAVTMARKSGLTVHQGKVQTANLPKESYDLAFMIQTIEHLDNPPEVLTHINTLLKPGGKLVIVTDNTGSIDFAWFKNRYWGGYHFPRHWNLFNHNSLAALAVKTGYTVASIETQVSPVNWVYTCHNYLVGKNAPKWLINRFTLKSTLSLSVFTALDMILQKFKRGALLKATLIK